MIGRYDKGEMSSIWSLQHKYELFLKVELAILKALEGNKIPPGTSEKIRNVAKINIARIDEIETKTKHDIIAFCTSITEQVDPEVGRYFHFGVTSSDIIDSAMTLQLKESLELILPSLKKVKKALHDLSQRTKSILAMGRSHGMYAEPFSFGQKWLGHYGEFARRYTDLERFYQEELTIQFSGAVGNYTILEPEAEALAAKELGVKVEPHSTQVIPRDRVAKLISLHGLLGTAIERLGIEIRHLHRSEVSEVAEGFSKGQKGSSTMPHKKNPISGENLSGLGRYLRSHVGLAMDNCLLWHERDISHSSAERLYLPDNMGILYYALERLASTLDNLECFQEKIEGRVEEQFSYLSSFYLHKLIENTNYSREKLYEWVQEAAFEGKNGGPKAFTNCLRSLLKRESIEVEISDMDLPEIKSLYKEKTEKVFNRVLENYPL